jgi:hypothetical protein
MHKASGLKNHNPNPPILRTHDHIRHVKFVQKRKLKLDANESTEYFNQQYPCTPVFNNTYPLHTGTRPHWWCNG